MSLRNRIKEILKPSPRRFAKTILGNQQFVAFDVGAANGLIPHWQTLDGFATVYGFEPHPESAANLGNKYNKSDFKDMYHVMPVGLSRNGGPAILYMLNAPTGSSILPVDMDSPLVHKDDAYIFPVKEEHIMTESLSNVMSKNAISHCDMIKLDVQGAELDIVLGMGEINLQQLLAVEMEVGFTSIYKGAPKPADVEQAMAPFGFELFDFNPLRSYAKKSGNERTYLDFLNQSDQFGSVNGKLVECDMLFIRKADLILNSKDVDLLRRYITVLCAYNLFTHALQVTAQAVEKGILAEQQKDEIFKAVKGWSGSSKRFFQNPAFTGIYNFRKKLRSHLGQQRWGQH